MSDSEKSGSDDSFEIETSRFDAETETLIRELYCNCCAFCLKIFTEGAMVCTEILDASEEGASQVAICSQLEIIPRDYQRQSRENGFILCVTCYPLFRHGYIALCPPNEILEYLVRYVRETPAEDQMPLYKILLELATPNPQLKGLPDTSAILPYVGLYSIVHLKPSKLQGYYVLTAFPPPLSIIHNGRWENAPNQSAPNDQSLAQIFDSIAVNPEKDQYLSPDRISVDPDQPRHTPKRYWRLQHTSLGGMLSAVILRSLMVPSTGTTADELKMVIALYDLLKIKNAGGIDAGLSGEGNGEEGGRRRGTRQKQAAEEEGNKRITGSAIAASS